MRSEFTKTLLQLGLILLFPPSANSSERAPFQIKVRVASVGIEAMNASKLPKLQLGVPEYLSFQEFTNTYHADWLNRSGVDYLSFAPLQMKPGEANGIDLSDNSYLTNRPADQFPIPTKKTGLFLRFEANTNSPPIELKCHFVYNSKNADDSFVRKGNYIGTLSFTNDVAIIRLPQITEETVAERKILGIRAGKKVNYDHRQILIVFQVTSARPDSK